MNEQARSQLLGSQNAYAQPTAIRDTPEVHQAVGRLRELIASIELVTSSLQERLEPVMSCSLAKSDGSSTAAPPKYSAPLANTIDFLADQLEISGLVLHGLRDRAQV